MAEPYKEKRRAGIPNIYTYLNNIYMVSSLFARVGQIFQGANPQALHLRRLFSDQRGPKPRTITKR